MIDRRRTSMETADAVAALRRSAAVRVLMLASSLGAGARASAPEQPVQVALGHRSITMVGGLLRNH